MKIRFDKHLNFILVLNLIFSLSLSSYTYAQQTPEFEPALLKEVWSTDDASELSINNLPRIFTIVRALFTQPSKVKIISKSFEDLLVLNPYSLKKIKNGLIDAPEPFHILTPEEEKKKEEGKLVYGLTKSQYREKKTLSEARFIKLLRIASQARKGTDKQLLRDLEEYLNEYPRDSEELIEAKTEYLNWKREYQDKKYRSIFLKKHAIPNLANKIKKLQKLMAKENTAQNKKLLKEMQAQLKALKAEQKEVATEAKNLMKKETPLEKQMASIRKDLRAIDDKIFEERFGERFRAILNDERRVNGFIRDNINSKPVALFLSQKDLAKGKLGYRLLEFVSSHQMIYDLSYPLPDPNLKGEEVDFEDPLDNSVIKKGLRVSAGEIADVWVRFIDGAKKTLAINAYEWDLPEIKEALIRAHKRGVKVRISFDLEAMHHYPVRMELYYSLREYVRKSGGDKNGSFHLSLIDSVSLNHQKLGVRDHESKSKAAVLASSANPTISGTKGDLVNSEHRHENALSNANHVSVIQSYLLANAVEHNLAKTQILRLRGTSGPNAYPKSGSMLVNTSHGGYSIIAFTPNGGDGNIHLSITAKALKYAKGDVRMLQFSASSPDVLDALLERAGREMKSNPEDWKLIGLADVASFLTDWSIFLKIAGFNRLGKAERIRLKAKFQVDKESAWREVFGDQYERIMFNIRSAPDNYGMFYLKDKKGNTVKDPETGKAILISAKLHHKTIDAGVSYIERETGYPVRSVVDGSTNATEGSLTNQEHYFVHNDPIYSKHFEAMIRGLYVDTHAENGILYMIDSANREEAGLPPRANMKKAIEYTGETKNNGMACSKSLRKASSNQ
ncbi:MAG: phospholipase D-like domain-containing protein [Bdellovibrionota bacterium]|nr:phospholipase D-like domain-containing protein [Bdellovibrionota bacterium]